MIGILSCQLINRFEEMKSVVTSYQVLKLSFLSNAFHLDLEIEAKKFLTNFLITSLCLSQMLSIKTLFKKQIAHLKSAEEMAFFIVENASLATNYPDICTAYTMNMAVPVTIATAERSFSKLKLITNFFQNSKSQERLNGSALLSIENKQAKNFDFGKVIQQSASAKARRKNFKSPTTCK